MRQRFRGVVPRGIVAGLLGATALAFWFLIIDGSQGEPFRTPASGAQRSTAPISRPLPRKTPWKSRNVGHPSFAAAPSSALLLGE